MPQTLHTETSGAPCADVGEGKQQGEEPGEVLQRGEVAGQAQCGGCVGEGGQRAAAADRPKRWGRCGCGHGGPRGGILRQCLEGQGRDGAIVEEELASRGFRR